MINLLSLDDRKQLAAARTNSLLFRYVILLAIFIAILFIEMGVVYVLLSVEKARSEAVIKENDSKTVAYSKTKLKADEFRLNLSTAKVILDQQVSYSKIILKVASVLPSGTVLERLALDPTTFGTPTVLTIQTSTYNAALDVKASLQASKLFTDVNFQSITSNPESTTPYKFTATYNVTYSKEALKL